MSKKYTPTQIERIEQSIAECDRYIAKEEPRASDLRPPEIAKLLAFYKEHRANLVKMIA